MSFLTVLGRLRELYGRKYVQFMCSNFGHSPKTQEWFRVWNSKDIEHPHSEFDKSGYMKGVDTFCQRCGELLGRHINVDSQEK
jgi:hypothetical protein